MTFQPIDPFSDLRQASIEGLRKDLVTLRLEVDRLRSAVTELTKPETSLEGGPIGGALDAAMDVASRTRATLQKRLIHADADVHEHIADLRVYVRENPLTAALIFAVCGYMAGRFK
jgi:hypothetical protein